MAGHLGARKTQVLLRERNFWKRWNGDVERYYRVCNGCNRYHRGGPHRQTHVQDMPVGAPWERIGIDLTDRHPRSRRGSHYLLTQFRTRKLRRCVVSWPKRNFRVTACRFRLYPTSAESLTIDSSGICVTGMGSITSGRVRIHRLLAALLSGCTDRLTPCWTG